MAITLGLGVTYHDTSVETSRKSPIRAIFGYGINSSFSRVSTTNLVNNYGAVASDTTGVGSVRSNLAAAGYGGDKAIFGYGFFSPPTAITNLVSNTGVVSADVTGVGTARYDLAAAGYGGDKAIFGYGDSATSGGGTYVSVTNLVSNTGVVSTDVAGVGTARSRLSAAGYGGDKAIFINGVTDVDLSLTNLVSNTGVVGTDVATVGGTSVNTSAAAGYGGDKAIFGIGSFGLTRLISNTGVVGADVTRFGVTITKRGFLAAAGYGGDKAIFGHGITSVAVSMTNLVSNSGVLSADVTGVGTARYGLAAASYSS